MSEPVHVHPDPIPQEEIHGKIPDTESYRRNVLDKQWDMAPAVSNRVSVFTSLTFFLIKYASVISSR